ncbi:MAG: 4-(cytidine 5'-diphospho)-2-C-methyl-D-erythritol kinase [Nitrospiria bacterium]
MVRSYAKINLFLKILDRRPDGYHGLLSLFQRIDLHDALRFEPEERGIVIESNLPSLPVDSSNLVYQAADLLMNRAKIKKGIRISIEKNIPVGGGLGGGSSNAAATLLQLNELWGLDYSPGELAEMGASLGSDVPFFCYRSSSAWVSGKGEIVQAVSIPADYWILLVIPSFSISTVDAYRLWDLSRDIDKNGLTKKENHNKISGFEYLKNEISRGLASHFFKNLENDFESILFNKYPVLKEIQDRLYQEKAEKVLLSGSGSTVFAIFSLEERARAGGEKLVKLFSPIEIQIVRSI